MREVQCHGSNVDQVRQLVHEPRQHSGRKRGKIDPRTGGDEINNDTVCELCEAELVKGGV